MKISELIKATGAKVLKEYEDREVRISTDTRTIQEGDFYLPLKGASFDGEKFIDQALEKGAVGAFYTDEKNLPQSAPFQGEVAQSAKGGKKFRIAPYITTFSRTMRQNMTPQELKLWQYIRKEQLGVKFRRQHPIDNKYIADFACVQKKLIIEIDGSQHVNNEKDKIRTIYLTNNGYIVIRFYNNEIDQNLKGCIEYLKQILDETPPTGFADFPLNMGKNISAPFLQQADMPEAKLQAQSAPFQGEVVQSTKGGKNTFIKVSNTLTAYLLLANYRRNKINPTVVAITGSSGKTTTKELVASVLSEKYKTFKTPLNHNNEIGFCQTIFEMSDDTEVLVLEMGMRGLGEIELLSKYAEPDITIIANVGTAHIGRLGSRENIAKAKCEIVKHQRGRGKYENCFIAHDDELIRKTVDFKGEQIYYSIKDVEILEENTQYSKFEYKGNSYELNVGGKYNIENALSAIICGGKMNLGINEVKEGLKRYHPIEKRWEGVNAGGYEIINDSYNANPESMRAFVDTIFELYDNYTLVLGDMGELGVNEVSYHRELGEYINNHKKLSPKTTIISIGELSKHITDAVTNCKTAHFETIEDGVNYIKSNISKSSILFLKASRSMKFERIIELLQA